MDQDHAIKADPGSSYSVWKVFTVFLVSAASYFFVEQSFTSVKFKELKHLDGVGFWTEKIVEMFDWQEFQQCKISLCDGCLSINYRNGSLKYAEGGGYIHGARKKQYISMFEAVANRFTIPDFEVIVNLGDKPRSCALNFCREVGVDTRKILLLPNHRFWGEDTLVDMFEDKSRWPSWSQVMEKSAELRSGHSYNERERTIFFSGRPHLPKVRLLTTAMNHSFAFHFHMLINWPHCWMSLQDPSSCGQKTLVGECDMCQSCKLCKKCFDAGMCSTDPASQLNMFKHQYQIYVDGNTRSDRLKHLLLTGSCLFNVESKYEEFYTHLLSPYRNFIPISSDLSNFTDAYQAGLNSTLCQQIIQNNLEFAQRILSEDSILAYLAVILMKISTFS